MKNKIILVLGSTGFIGRSVVKRLLADGNKLICPVRNPDKVKRNILSGDIGQIDIVPFDLNNPSNIEEFIKKSDLVINLIGLLYEKTNFSFETAHFLLPKKISLLASKYSKPFLHLSSLGSTFNTKSNYLYSKKLGEEFIENNSSNYVIIRPSVVFGEEDNFINQFGRMAKFLPFLPLYKEGKTKFQPIYINDLTLMIFNIVNQFESYKNKNLQAVGSKIYSFRDILNHIFITLSKKPKFINIPSFFAIIQGKIMEKLPRPIFTYDQFVTLEHDSIATNIEISVSSIIKQDLADMKIVSKNYLQKFVDRV